MPDRIAEILSAHIDLAKKQLGYMKDGTRFEDVAGALPVDESDLMVRIGNLEAALERHETRNA